MYVILILVDTVISYCPKWDDLEWLTYEKSKFCGHFWLILDDFARDKIETCKNRVGREYHLDSIIYYRSEIIIIKKKTNTANPEYLHNSLYRPCIDAGAHSSEIIGFTSNRFLYTCIFFSLHHHNIFSLLRKFRFCP